MYRYYDVTVIIINIHTNMLHEYRLDEIICEFEMIVVFYLQFPTQ